MVRERGGRFLSPVGAYAVIRERGGRFLLPAGAYAAIRERGGRFLFPAGADCRSSGTRRTVFVPGWGLCRDSGTRRTVFAPSRSGSLEPMCGGEYERKAAKMFLVPGRRAIRGLHSPGNGIAGPDGAISAPYHPERALFHRRGAIPKIWVVRKRKS